MKRADLEREVYKALFQIKKASPEILLFGGVVGVVGRIVTGKQIGRAHV